MVVIVMKLAEKYTNIYHVDISFCQLLCWSVDAAVLEI